MDRRLFHFFILTLALSSLEGQVDRRLQQSAPLQQHEESAAGIQTLPGFHAEVIYEVPRNQGSWASMTFDPQGRVVAGAERGGLYRMTLDTGEVEKLDVDLPGGSHGLLYAFDSLYATVSGPGRNALFRLRDTNGDGEIDDVDKLVTMGGPGGEHGPHAIRPSPDGKKLYFIAGNHTFLPDNATGGPTPRIWQEDVLLPRLWDPLGHAVQLRAPGGFVCRMNPDGSEIEVVTIGLRNAYDLAFNRQGELLTFDSDMERDVFLPWYRPTRIVHLVSGADYGWRSGSAKWLPHYPDSLPAVCDIGLGSPTGIVFGYDSNFPGKYKEALYALDWTLGRVLAVHLEPEGSSYGATYEEFLRGRPLPFTDAEFAPDGSLVMITGGRGTSSRVIRVRSESTNETVAGDFSPATDTSAGKREQRRHYESFHGAKDRDIDLEEVFRGLSDGDRHLRSAARIALEHQPLDAWASRALEIAEPLGLINATVGIARTGEESWRQPVFEALGTIDFQALSPPAQADLVRAYTLTFTRWGKEQDAMARAVRDRLEPYYPAVTYLVNHGFAELMVYLEAPEVIPRTLELAENAARTEHAIHYLKTLRLVDDGWSPILRERYFASLALLLETKGATHVTEKTSRVLQDFEGYLQAIVEGALERVPENERTRFDDLLASAKQPEETAPVTPPQGPGKVWTTEELANLASREALENRDLENGKAMFAAGACATCHRIGSHGGVIGPNLSTLGNRFTVKEIIESIVEPNAVLSDQFAYSTVTTKSGQQHTGRIVQETIEMIRLAINPYDPSQTVDVPTNEIDTIERSDLSPMPPALINAMNRDEVLDLLAYLVVRN